MEKIKVLIVEDKAIVAESIAAQLRRQNIEVAGIFASGEEALQSLPANLPDLVLMDIHLDGALDGIATAKLMRDQYALPVIYLSDFEDEQTVRRAAKTNPANYLGKPFQEHQLIRAIHIALANAKVAGKQPDSTSNDHIFIKTDNGHVKLAFNDIVYLEADRSYCKVVTDSKTFVQTISLNHVLDQFNKPDFVRVHRSHVVNLKKITELQGNTVVLGKHKVEMSKGMRDELTSRIKFLK